MRWRPEGGAVRWSSSFSEFAPSRPKTLRRAVVVGFGSALPRKRNRATISASGSLWSVCTRGASRSSHRPRSRPLPISHCAARTSRARMRAFSSSPLESNAAGWLQSRMASARRRSLISADPESVRSVAAAAEAVRACLPTPLSSRRAASKTAARGVGCAADLLMQRLPDFAAARCGAARCCRPRRRTEDGVRHPSCSRPQSPSTARSGVSSGPCC